MTKYIVFFLLMTPLLNSHKALYLTHELYFLLTKDLILLCLLTCCCFFLCVQMMMQMYYNAEYTIQETTCKSTEAAVSCPPMDCEFAVSHDK